MENIPDISDMLKDSRISFTNEELKKIIETELSKPECEQNNELINLCRTLSEKEENPMQENKSKRKFSFRLISLIVTIAVLIFAMIPVFSKYINTDQIVTNPPAENKTIESTVSEKIPTTTENPTEAVSDPTKPVTNVDTESSVSFLHKPEEILFYHDGKPQSISGDNVMCDEVIEIINDSIKNEKWGILKLAVEEGYIDKIKNENLCIEIYYNDLQTLDGLQGHTQDEYSFEKILIILDGSDKNTMFFCKDKEYQHGPIKPYNSVLSEEILAYIFD